MSAQVSMTPRPMTSGSGPRMHLPVIEHPMSRMGDHNSLSINGEMTRLGLSAREQTFVTVGEDGRLHTGLDRTGLPPLESRTNSACSILSASNSDYPVRNLSDKGKYRRLVENTPRVGSDELEHLLADKLAMEPHGIKHLFRTNDPNGQGTVTREGLLKVLYSLFGYISNEHFIKLLKRMGIDNTTQITYDHLANYFTYSENKPTAWVSPINHKVDIQTKHVEDHLRTSPEHLIRNKVISSSTCHMLLRDRVKSKIQMLESSMNSLLPESCQDVNGIMLPAQLLDLLNQLNISVRQEDFQKLWQRYDKEGVGALKKAQLFSIIGLDKDGYIPTTPVHRNVIVNTRAKTFIEKPMMVRMSKMNEAMDNCNLGEPTKEIHSPRKHMREVSRDAPRDPGRSDTRISADSKIGQTIRQIARKKTAPKIENVIEMLHYKFEEPYNSMLTGMQCFDFLGDGIITKIDLKRVFDEFGFQMLAMDMDQFLSRIGSKVMRNQVQYKDLLDKFWNRCDSGLVNRIVTTNKHFFLNDGYHGYADHLTPEEMEAQLVEFFHKDYYIMTHYIKSADNYKLGVVTKHEFRDAVQKALGYTMSPRQWDALLTTVGLDCDGLVPYTKFLQTFNSPKPGQWKREFSPSQKKATRPAVDSLRERSQEEAAERQPEMDRLKEDSSEAISIELKHRVARNINSLHDAKHGRSLQELNSIVREVFQHRFAAIDKAFKTLDPKMTERVNKPEFVSMLNQCDLEILPLEGDRLWENYDVASDGMMTFSTIVQHYKDFKNITKHPEEHNLEIDNLPEFHGKYGFAYHNVESDECIAMPPNSPVPDYEAEFTQNNEKLPTNLTTQSANNYTKASRLADIMDKIKYAVKDHWNNLKQILLHTDCHGEGIILGMDMKDIMKTLRLPLTESELHTLLGAYDKRRDGRFHYLDFLKHYAEASDTESGHPWDNSFMTEFKLIIQQKDPKEDSTFLEVMDRLRADLNRPSLLKEHKSIRRAFKKADTNGDGVLSIAEFKNLMKTCKINVRAEDLYHIISEFDVNMNGKVAYSKFLSHILF